MSRKPPMLKTEPADAGVDETAVEHLREQMADLAPGWHHQVVVLPPGPQVARLNLWQRFRYRLAKRIMP